MRVLGAGLAVLLAVGGGCKRSGEGGAEQPLRVGFFPNITHAQALVGNAEGTFAQALGQVEMKAFNAGPEAMQALLSGSVEASYVGMGPAINAYLKGGRELRVVAGAVEGGAVLVTRTARSPEELRGKTLASPQLGNSQDIALRTWLAGQGLQPGKDVRVVPMANPEILGLFQQGQLEGAWVPEPWGTRLILEGGGHLLVDERELWPQGRFSTTLLVTTERVLRERPEQVRKLLQAHVELTQQWQADPRAFRQRVAQAFQKLTRHELKPEVLEQAFTRLEPALEVQPQVLQEEARHAAALGYLPQAELQGMVDTSLLEQVRAQAR